MGKIIAVDFDGTLCKNKWPEIGEPYENVIEWLKTLKTEGYKIILWTCRCGLELNQAIKWCRDRGLEFDEVNRNLLETIEKFGHDPRKIYADLYIDDHNLYIYKGKYEE